MTDGREIYQNKVKGVLDENWSDWFNGMTVTLASGITTLSSAVADQPRLYGLLSKIRDLNLTPISVTRIEPEKDRSHPQQGGE